MESSQLFDRASAALVLIDLQQGIVPSPMLAPHSGADVARRGSELAGAFRGAGSPVVYVQVDAAKMAHLPTDRSFRNPSDPPPPPEAMNIAAEAGFQTGDLLVTKRVWGAFQGTKLDEFLRSRGIKTIVLGGIATNFGVESTARSAADLGYAVVFAEDAMTTIGAEAQAFAIGQLFPFIGRVRTTAQILSELGR
jgi:nicotinamidase-related amidase